MTFATTSGRFALLLMGATALSYGTPAVAGRGTQIDQPFYAPSCSLGSSSCGGFDVHASGIFSTAYLYKEGIVSFDGLLPTTAVANDPASLGTGSWFAPGLSASANYQVSVFVAYLNNTTAFAFNFFAPGAKVFDDADGFADFPLFQVQLGPVKDDDGYDDEGFYTETQVFFGYDLKGDPTPGALIGFSTMGTTQTVFNKDGLLVGPGDGDTDFVTNFGRLVDGTSDRTGPSLFVPKYEKSVAAVPEPGTWALMLAGFAVLGSALRMRSRKKRAVTA